jgi:hypothetical protein
LRSLPTTASTITSCKWGIGPWQRELVPTRTRFGQWPGPLSKLVDLMGSTGYRFYNRTGQAVVELNGHDRLPSRLVHKPEVGRGRLRRADADAVKKGIVRPAFRTAEAARPRARTDV